ncbi:branched-chain amino acid transport system II carrier protein [Bergeyella sp. RCAD1439]|uniref:branched-chain amino acid transport system II carrier protein n=1 Tax=Bergeyella anatis TaxID=3113737 RepID=UPI002E193BF7|nr:branched-chain amino acid transport system II carrier protein [Bergeyella sp. RCAD1439]
MNKKFATSVTLGFALFAMFFGAGNLVLPPYIGIKSGGQWLWAVAGFLTTGIVAPFLSVLTVAKYGDSFTDLGRRVSPWVIRILAFLIMLCIGPLVAIPRTASTTFEVGVLPLVPGFNGVVFSLIFFALIYLLCVSKSKIVDIIGNYLTPFLMVVLGVLVFVGIYRTAGVAPLPTDFSAQEAYIYAFHEGYQTLDVLAGVVFAGIIISAAIAKGYTGAKERLGITVSAGLISMVALLVIYGGLIYLGAHYESSQGGEVSRTALLLGLSRSVLGGSGTLVVSVAMALACVTTAIALTSAMGDFLEEWTKGKLKYRWGVLLTCLFSAYLSVKSVDEIIEYAVVILGFVYPVTFTLILTILFFGRYVTSPRPYLAAVSVAAFLALGSVFLHWGVFAETIERGRSFLPLSARHLEWVLPSFLAFGVTALMDRGRRA